MKKLLTILLLSFTISSHAGTCKDNWSFAPDKQKHFAGSALIALTTTAVTKDPWIGFGASTAVGVVKELQDVQSSMHCASWKDLGYDTLGALSGAWLGNQLFISPNKIIYFKEF